MLFMSCVCHALAAVYGCLVITCWQRADLLALVVMFNFVSVTFPCGTCILGQVWLLIVSTPYLCRLSYFVDEIGHRLFPTAVIENNRWCIIV